jgi:rfaE bifunctional protein nucleotidyltransferase chain/domain
MILKILMKNRSEKIHSLDGLAQILNKLKKKRKKIVMCHGVFDLLHPGHILYFKAAKKHGDILVVTVTPDKYVNKGPGRPVFNERLRMESIGALACVDYVALNHWPTAVETILKLKPDSYVKGQDYADLSADITGKIKEEISALKKVGGQIFFTNEEMFSSSTLLNKFFSTHPEPTQTYLDQFRKKYPASFIMKKLKDLSKLRVLVVGEAILDQYSYCNPMAKSPKETIVASRFVSEENFAGGSMAIANHVAGFCNQVSLVSTIGNEKSVSEFFKSKIGKRVSFHPIHVKDRPTVTKRRYVEPNFLTKMFEIQYLEDTPLAEDDERKVIETLRKLLPKHDLVIVADYGHGFLTEKIRNEISSLSKFLCVNVQTNSANYGYNVATKYHGIDFISMDDPELRLAMRNKFGDVTKMAAQLREKVKAGVLLVSRGPRESVITDKSGAMFKTPVFSTKALDRVGAGDALFSITSPCVYMGLPIDLVAFLGNCAGAMAVEIICNREPINPMGFSKFVTMLLK